jgi:hypothetical protein
MKERAYRRTHARWLVMSVSLFVAAACSGGATNADVTSIDASVMGGGGYPSFTVKAMAGQVDRLWVLDVNGQRVVVDATYSPDTTQAERDRLGQVATSLRFLTP